MAISVSCACGKTLSVKDELAGKRGKCPACGAMLSIPVPVPAPAAEIEEWGLAPLDDEPKPVKVAPTKPAAAKPGTPSAKSAAPSAKPQAQAATAPAKPALLADDYGLAPLEDEVTKPAPVAAKPATKAAPAPAKAAPAPAAKAPATNPAKPQANGASATAPVKAPAPAKPAATVDDDFLSLAPLDDDLFGKPAAASKPAAAKPAPTPTAAAKPATNPAKPQANGSAPNSAAAPATKPAPAKNGLGGAAPALLDLSPLDESGTPQGDKPAPAVSGKTPAPATKSSAPAAATNLGGPAPAMLDLGELDAHGNLATVQAGAAPTAAAKPPVAAAAPAKKPADGPAPLDLPALDGAPEQNHADWIDEGAETEFKLDGPALSVPAGTFSTPVKQIDLGGHNEPEGEMSCPRCGARLTRTLTVWTLPIRMMIGRFIILLNGPIAPFKCKGCGKIHYEELNGPSRREADRTGFKHLFKVLGQFFLLVSTVIGVGGIAIKMMQGDPHREMMDRMERDRLEREQRYNPMFHNNGPGSSRPLTPAEIEALKKRNEELKRKTQERSKKQADQNKQPTTPRPNPSSPATPTPAQVNDFKQAEINRRLEEAKKQTGESASDFSERMRKQAELNRQSTTPRPSPTPTPNTPAPKTSPTPMPAVSPFEETTLPPTPAPKPMPVNPFQPID